jgi:class 3 adenylate cyclase/tetratricopeptide (TPR) repeat protein
MTESELLEKLAAYVPTPVTYSIYQNPQLSVEPAARRFLAVILFSDISGFTALSEVLSRAGPVGAEELTQLINLYFTQMIQIIQSYRGQVVKFSGDALTVLFSAEKEGMTLAVRRAGECAMAMQAKMADFATFPTSRGNASLSMKVGIGAGEVLECSVGGALGRWEYMVAGVPLVQVAMAEHEALPGQIILSPQAWREAERYFIGLQKKGDQGFVQLFESLDPILPSPPLDLDWNELEPQDQKMAERSLECYVPGAIKARLNGQADWLAELRRMTIVFVGIGGIDYEAPNAGEWIQNFLYITQELVYRFEGSLNKVAVDDKGTVLLVLFGAPPISHEDNPTRAVAFALNLQTVAREQGLRMSIGITEGTMFAGPVGAPNRREYTVIGDEVNLAARFMQYGRAGTIIVSDRVKERIGSQFIVESLGQISVKGKAQHLKAYAVKGEQGSQEEFVMRYLLHDDPLVGRQAELERLRQISAKAKAGQLQLLFIEGELGVGKSRLTSELLREWMIDGGVSYGGRCVSYDRQIPYRAWRDVLTALYGLTPSLSSQRQLARLAAGIAELEDLHGHPDYWANRLPLLSDVLGLEAPDNDFTRTISGQLRRNNTFALIEALLQHQIERRPMLILLEDIHWADELSLALASYLARKMVDSPLLLVLVHRPIPESDMAIVPGMKDLPYAHTLSLKSLSLKESTDLIDILFKDKQLPVDAKEILLSRGQGNPFFLQEMANAILSVLANKLTQPNSLLEVLNLPDTVQDVVLTHLDRLSETERLTLKIASVIGTRFQRSLLSSVHPMPQNMMMLSNQLTRLEDEKLIQLDTPAPKWEYHFHSVVVHEVVYEGLLLSQRRQLHEAVGRVLESLVPDEVEQLAFHYSHSANWQKALYYLRAAAEKTRREYANQAAIGYYTQILGLLSSPPTPEIKGTIFSPNYWDALLERARLYNLIGQREQELEDLGTLGLLAESLDDTYRRALVAKQWAYYYETCSDYASGLELIERCVQLAEQIEAERLVGEGYIQWGKLLYLRGEYEVASDYLQRALVVAQKYNDQVVQADCLNNLGVVAHYQADYDVALYFFPEAIELWRSLGDQVGLGNSLNHVGQVYYNLSRYKEARTCYEESLTLHLTIGDRAGEALARLNLGQVLRSLGDYEAAREFLEEALVIFQTLDDRRHEAYSLCHLGFLHCRLAQYDAAVAELEGALAILQHELDDPRALARTLHYYSWTLINKNEPKKAKRHVEEALKIERDTQQAAAMIEEIVHLGRIALLVSDLSLAEACVRNSLDFLKKTGIQGIEHVPYLYLTCYQILQASQKFEKAQDILAEGYRYLTWQLDQIDDPGLRENYLYNIPENQMIYELGQQLN